MHSMNFVLKAGEKVTLPISDKINEEVNELEVDDLAYQLCMQIHIHTYGFNLTC